MVVVVVFSAVWQLLDGNEQFRCRLVFRLLCMVSFGHIWGARGHLSSIAAARRINFQSKWTSELLRRRNAPILSYTTRQYFELEFQGSRKRSQLLVSGHIVRRLDRLGLTAQSQQKY